MRLQRAPYCVVPRQRPDEAAADMVAAFQALAPRRDKVACSFATLTQGLPGSRHSPLRLAGQAIAEAIDAGAGGADAHAYHNRQHFVEVLLCANFLCLLHGVSSADTLIVLLASLIHDFHHDGAGNAEVPFRLERIALERAGPYFRSHGVGVQMQRQVAALVLATESRQGLAFLRSAHAHHVSRAAAMALPPQAPELDVLLRLRPAITNALILCEADVLPSIGLTVDHALEVQHRLAAEWGRPLDAVDKLGFIDFCRGAGVVPGYFAPNVQRLREALGQDASVPHGV